MVATSPRLGLHVSRHRHSPTLTESAGKRGQKMESRLLFARVPLFTIWRPPLKKKKTFLFQRHFTDISLGFNRNIIMIIQVIKRGYKHDLRLT